MEQHTARHAEQPSIGVALVTVSIYQPSASEQGKRWSDNGDDLAPFRVTVSTPDQTAVSECHCQDAGAALLCAMTRYGLAGSIIGWSGEPQAYGDLDTGTTYSSVALVAVAY